MYHKIQGYGGKQETDSRGERQALWLCSGITSAPVFNLSR